MTLIKCTECGAEISDGAVMCPKCGFISGDAMRIFEYRSQRQLFGLPLVHVVWGPGINPATGRPRVAKGIIAAGPVAIGAIALGGVSLGLISFGGLALGLCCALGGAAVGGLLAVGGAAVAGLLAVGGAAVGYIAIGGGGWGVHVLCGSRQDASVVDFFKGLFGS